MRALVAVAFYLLYWAVCFLGTGTDKKNLIGLRSYPTEVQRRVREDPQLGPLAPAPRPIWLTLLANIMPFTILFSVIGIALKGPLGLDDFWQAFLYLLALGEGLGLFDLVIIDLLWWRHTRRVRFSFIPDAQAYQNPSQHVGSFLRGIPMFAAVALLAAIIVGA